MAAGGLPGARRGQPAAAADAGRHVRDARRHLPGPRRAPRRSRASPISTGRWRRRVPRPPRWRAEPVSETGEWGGAGRRRGRPVPDHRSAHGRALGWRLRGAGSDVRGDPARRALAPCIGPGGAAAGNCGFPRAVRIGADPGFLGFRTAWSSQQPQGPGAATTTPGTHARGWGWGQNRLPEPDGGYPLSSAGRGMRAGFAAASVGRVSVMPVPVSQGRLPQRSACGR